MRIHPHALLVLSVGRGKTLIPFWRFIQQNPPSRRSPKEGLHSAAQQPRPHPQLFPDSYLREGSVSLYLPPAISTSFRFRSAPVGARMTATPWHTQNVLKQNRKGCALARGDAAGAVEQDDAWCAPAGGGVGYSISNNHHGIWKKRLINALPQDAHPAP